MSASVCLQPVCTTEIGRLALKYKELESKNVKLATLSCDPVRLPPPSAALPPYPLPSPLTIDHPQSGIFGMLPVPLCTSATELRMLWFPYSMNHLRGAEARP